MDPYRSIPEEKGEIIRELVRKRKEMDSEVESPSKRLRTQADDIERTEADDPYISDEDPIKPEDDLKKYDYQRLNNGLKKMTKLAVRKVTPRTNEFLKIHIDAYKIALHDAVRKEASVAVVQALDQVYCSEAFLLKPRMADEHDFHMQFVKLRRMELLANYEDYLDQSLQEAGAHLKKAVAAKDVSSNTKEASAAFSGPKTWQAIAAEITADPRDIRRHVFVVSAILGLDSLHMKCLINEWATRNNQFYNKIRDQIINCRWSQVASTICRDVKELLQVSSDRDTASKYEKVLISLRDQYFEVMDEEDSDFWMANEKAKNLTKEYLARQKTSR